VLGLDLRPKPFFKDEIPILYGIYRNMHFYQNDMDLGKIKLHFIHKAYLDPI
jgi:hypothetical protein